MADRPPRKMFLNGVEYVRADRVHALAMENARLRKVATAVLRTWRCLEDGRARGFPMATSAVLYHIRNLEDAVRNPPCD